jgi:SAM-dependent methyltransferase
MKIHRGNFKSNKLFLKKLEKMGILKHNHTIPEIGSGHGAMVNFLRNKGYNILGTEINDEYIQSAKENFGVNLIKFNGKNYPFGKNKFDIIISFDVFEHIPNTHFHLQEIKKVLKNDGCYLFGTPNKITNILFEIIKGKSLTKWKKYHCSLYTYWGLKKIFKQQGFNISFIKIPIVNDFFKEKVRKYIGGVGLRMLSICNPDKLPLWLRTNFFVITNLEVR